MIEAILLIIYVIGWEVFVLSCMTDTAELGGPKEVWLGALIWPVLVFVVLFEVAVE